MTAGFKPRIWKDPRTQSWIAAVPAVRETAARIGINGSWDGALQLVRRFYRDAAAPTSGGAVYTVPAGDYQLFSGPRRAGG